VRSKTFPTASRSLGRVCLPADRGQLRPMERIRHHRVTGTGAAGLLGLLALHSALAAPPPSRQLQSAAQHLDLSAPSQILFSEKSTGFPSAARAQTRNESLDARAPIDLPRGPVDHANMEDMVQRVHKEGLPVARLWHNNTSLLHVGFNQKGKPGVWFVKNVK
jgi:hypothetical protein